MRVYVVTSARDPYSLPLAVFDTLRECADFIGVTFDHLKHCKCRPHNGIYVTRYFNVEAVKIEAQTARARRAWGAL